MNFQQNNPLKKSSIIVVDDDIDILQFVTTCLHSQNYEVFTANNGFSAIDQIVQSTPNLVLLDLAMPGMSGLEVLKYIREKINISSYELPIIILSAQDDEVAKIQALDLGADDYLTKPFNVNELFARVRVALRRVGELKEAKIKINGAKFHSSHQDPGIFQAGRLEVDLESRIVKVEGREIRLTPTEFSLLEQLITNTDKVITHRQVLNKVWGQEYNNETEYLRTFIKQLRRKVEEDPSRPVHILTEPGIGYRFKK